MDTLVSQFVLSAISDTQRRESRVSARANFRTMSAVCFFARVTLRHLLNMFACLRTLASFLFVSFYHRSQ